MLEACDGPDAWDRATLVIKQAHGGGYPADWYKLVLAPGGIADKLKAKWGIPTAFDMGVVSILR
jgi:hypothetical protein